MESASTDDIDFNLELTESTIDTDFTDREQSGTYKTSEAVKITLNKTTATVSGNGAEVDGSTITITEEGVYLVSGTLEDGQIIVDASDSDKVQIVLDGASINCETNAAIYVREADKVFITLAEDSENTLSSGTEYTQIDDNTVDGVIFSKSDLACNGTGSLTIEANYKHGIVSKDDLVITGGTYNITAADNGITAKDQLKILDGTFNIDAANSAVNAASSSSDGSTSGMMDGKEPPSDTENSSGMQPPSDDSTDGTDRPQPPQNSDGTAADTTRPELPDGADFDPDNAPSGSMMQGGPGGGGDSEIYIKITGGSLTVSADGDGLDSNGSLLVTGGTTIVYGATSDGDGALDYDGGATVTGGTLAAIGSAGMTQGFGENSTQPSITCYCTETQSADTNITLTDSKGNALFTVTPEKAYASIVFTFPDLNLDETYTLTAGTDTEEITITDTLTTAGTQPTKTMGDGPGGGNVPNNGDSQGTPPSKPDDASTTDSNNNNSDNSTPATTTTEA